MRAQTFTIDPSALADLGGIHPLDSAATLVLVFGPSNLLDDTEAAARLKAYFPQSQVHGCSTSGAIHELDIIDDRLIVAVARFEHTRLISSGSPISDAMDSERVGKLLAEGLPKDELRAVLVLSDGLQVNGTGLIEGLNANLPDGVVVTGGLAGDADRFERTWVFVDGEMRSGYVTAVGFYGDVVRIGHGSKGGWDIFGVERTVTRSSGNVLYELDGRPALELYKEYLGDRADGLPATALLFPLALRAGNDGDQIVRTVLAVNEDDQSMTFAGDLPQGSRVQLMRANFDRLIDGASGAALMTKASKSAESDLLVVAISCVGRRLVLGERSEEEVESVLDEMPEGTHQVGFYSYGEISPYGSGQCQLHNQTMTLTTITEA
ncbi:MAG: FIST C-terminal domain-containing protein [Chromatiales bacterium]|nr:FIST C-terminal domain-containing protein [Chromatiales bacterium]